jgi:membrane fusion protein, heavy metal efflux system
MAAVAPLIQASHAHQANLILELEHWQSWASELEGIAEAAGGQAAALAEARGRVAAARSAITDEDEKCLVYQRELADLRALVSPLEHQVEAAASRVEAAEVALAGTLRALEAGRMVAAAMLGAEAGETDWTEQRYIEIRADTPGVVTRLHVQPGGRAGTDATLVETLDVGRVRFRARALQSDLGKLRDGIAARVVGPGGHEPAEGSLTIAPGANPETRTLELLLVPEAVPAWARPGVVGQLEVVWDRTSQAELAVPAAAVLRDGLEHVLFVRDPDDSNKVIRATPQIGPSDGRWRVVYSDVIAGDEVVVAGAYELKLTGAGQATQSGHFHADGTWHADAH